MRICRLPVLLLLTGCAAAPVETPADRAIAHWIGRPIGEVTRAWGEPAEEQVVEGRRLYIWPATHYGPAYYPANFDAEQLLPFDRSPEELACKGVIEVDRQGVVTDASWQGYECNFLP